MYEYDEFARCVGNLKKRIQKRVSDALKPYNLSSMHSMYLMTLYHKGELTLVELTGELKFNRANTSRVIRDLIQKGYVVCDKNENNLRKYKVFLSEEGRKVAESFDTQMENFKIEDVSRLTHEEWTTLIALLNKLTN